MASYTPYGGYPSATPVPKSKTPNQNPASFGAPMAGAAQATPQATPQQGYQTWGDAFSTRTQQQAQSGTTPPPAPVDVTDGLKEAFGFSPAPSAAPNLFTLPSAGQTDFTGLGVNMGGTTQPNGANTAQQAGALAKGADDAGVWGDRAGAVLGDANKAKYPTEYGHDQQSSALGQALIDAIYGKAQYGVDPELLNANMAAVQKNADKAKIQQNQILGARGFGMSGAAAADLGGIQSSADAKKADIAYQNAIDAAKQRNDMILGLGGLTLQDYQLGKALEAQEKADKWTAVPNILSVLGIDKTNSDKLAAYFKAAGLDDAAAGLDAMFGTGTTTPPPPGGGTGPTTSGATPGSDAAQASLLAGGVPSQGGAQPVLNVPEGTSQETIAKLSQPAPSDQQGWINGFDENGFHFFYEPGIGWVRSEIGKGGGTGSSDYLQYVGTAPEQLRAPAPTDKNKWGIGAGYEDGYGHWWYYSPASNSWQWMMSDNAKSIIDQYPGWQG